MFDLTIPQKNIWNLQRFYENTSISNVCGAVFFKEKCDHELLNKAINKTIELQAGLRLHFCEEFGKIGQYEAEYVENIFPSAFFQDMDEFDIHAEEYARRPFETFNSQMYRFEIFDVGNTSGVLLCASHLVVDAWSVSIVARMVFDVYYSLINGSWCKEQTYTYKDFVEKEAQYLMSNRYKKDRSFWKDKYNARPSLSSVKPMASGTTGASAKRYSTVVSTERYNRIKRFSEENHISETVLFESAIVTYLNRINTDNDSVTLGMLIYNREGIKDKGMIGDCVTTMPLTICLKKAQTPNDLFALLITGHSNLFRHQKYPYNQIQHDLRERYGFSGNLYDILYSYQNAKTGIDATTKWYSNGFCEVPLEFHVDNRDEADEYTLNLDYQTEVFQEQEVALLAKRILYILDQILLNPGGDLSDICILPDEEYNRVVFDFNQTYRSVRRDKCVHELFAQQVIRNPEKAALVFHDITFTYKQLDEMSNSLAHYLRDKGVGRGNIVPIASKRSWHFIVAMLGIMKAGAAYMHIDITYPEERIQYMLKTARSELCLTYGYNGTKDIEEIPLETFDYDHNTEPISNINTPSDLCYVIFTSGSTGNPKGLMIAHRNAVNFAAQNDLNVYDKIIENTEESILAISSTSFDMSVTETLLPLMDGITIYLADDRQVLSQAEISFLISKYKIGIMETTPTKMRIYLSDRDNLDYLKCIKAFILGGESLPMDLYNDLRNLSAAVIFNNYGPAETTVWSTIKEMDDEHITVGKPIANTQVYILDQQRRPLPIGIPGEICISGDGVGLGYLNQPEMTAEKYIQDPFNADRTMYCTGDLGAWNIYGEVEHLGRIDTQVKVRGLRIELGEIESVITEFPGVRMSAVAKQEGADGRQYLIGFYVGDQKINEKQLRAFLAERLPQFMIPNYLMKIDAIPMTSSGKTDRKALPHPSIERESIEYVAPETEEEIILCTILEKLLSRNGIGVTHDFFEIGGDSLCAIEYVYEAHVHGIEFPLQSVFDYPTVRELCASLGNQRNDDYVPDPESFLKYDKILKTNACTTVEAQDLGNVLVTGATGFLGAHVMEQLIQTGCGKIYCLVRGNENRIMETVDYYFSGKYDSLIGNKIIPLKGDLTDEAVFDVLPADVNTTIHTAASVKHYGSYRYFYENNVLTTKRMVAYAKSNNAKLIYISTVSVSGNSLADMLESENSEIEMAFTEKDIYIGQPLKNVYVRSKFESEVCVLDAILEGLDAIIIRVGNLTNRVSDYKFQHNYESNAYLKRIKAVLELGYLPESVLSQYAEFSPVDQTAEGIIKIAQCAKGQTIFHLNSNSTIDIEELVRIMNNIGISLKVVDDAEFAKILIKVTRDQGKKYIYEALQNDLDENGKLSFNNNIHVKNDFTAAFMKTLGFEWRRPDEEYMKGYIKYYRDLGYLSV